MQWMPYLAYHERTLQELVIVIGNLFFSEQSSVDEFVSESKKSVTTSDVS